MRYTEVVAEVIIIIVIVIITIIIIVIIIIILRPLAQSRNLRFCLINLDWDSLKLNHCTLHVIEGREKQATEATK